MQHACRDVLYYYSLIRQILIYYEENQYLIHFCRYLRIFN